MTNLVYADYDPRIYLKSIIQLEEEVIEGFLLLNLSPYQISKIDFKNNESILMQIKEAKLEFTVFDSLVKIPLNYDGNDIELLYVFKEKFKKIKSSNFSKISVTEVIEEKLGGCYIVSKLRSNNQFWSNKIVLKTFNINGLYGMNRLTLYYYENNLSLENQIARTIDITEYLNSNLDGLTKQKLFNIKEERNKLIEALKTENNLLIVSTSYD